MFRPRWVLACAALASGVLLGGCGAPSHPPARPSARPLISIIQDDELVQREPAPVLSAARRLGVQMIRTNVFWKKLAPDPTSRTPPAAFNGANPADYPAAGWAVYDRVVREAAAAGISVDFTVTGPGPIWAAGRHMPHTRNCPCGQWKPSPARFGAFVHALGVRYSGRYVPAGATQPLPRVSFWSIWNEPNYGPNLAPQAIDGSTIEVSPGVYRRLLRAAWAALARTGHSTASDTILIGETAPRGQTGPNLPGNFAGMVPLRFIRALYCVDRGFHALSGTAATVRGCPIGAAERRRFVEENPALFHASGWADHPYPDALAPTIQSPPPFGGGFADFAALPNLFGTLDRAAAAWGFRVRMPVYSTEFGYRTNPPSQLGLPLPEAAMFLNEAEYLSWRNPRIRSYDQYLLTDPAPSSGSDFVTGLQFANGEPKPAVYEAFRMPLWLPVTRARRGSQLEVWGCVRPAPAIARLAHRRQLVAIQFSAAGGPFKTLRWVRIGSRESCYFDVRVAFPRSGTVRLAWREGGLLSISREQQLSMR